MLTALEEGYSVALTADVPKVARVCGLGIVKLASMSGRAIYPMAIATGRRRVLNNWDRSAVTVAVRPRRKDHRDDRACAAQCRRCAARYGTP